MSAVVASHVDLVRYVGCNHDDLLFPQGFGEITRLLAISEENYAATEKAGAAPFQHAAPAYALSFTIWAMPSSIPLERTSRSAVVS
jgi:hypothetical protein